MPIDTSFDGGPAPQGLVARTRTKYRPGGATAETVRIGPPVSIVTRFVRPLLEPTSIKYDAGTPPAGADHDNVTFDPATANPRLPGAFGGMHAPPTVIATSLDAGPTPAALRPRTRT